MIKRLIDRVLGRVAVDASPWSGLGVQVKCPSRLMGSARPWKYMQKVGLGFVDMECHC